MGSRLGGLKGRVAEFGEGVRNFGREVKAAWENSTSHEMTLGELATPDGMTMGGGVRLPDLGRPLKAIKLFMESRGNGNGGGSTLETSIESHNLRPNESPHYSVEFSAQLSEDLYPGRSENAHFADANRQLYEAIQGDTEFGAALESRYPGITEHVTPGPRGGYSRTPPTEQGLTWHHHPENAGVLELVPQAHHAAPGPVQTLLHPEQRGGMVNWGGGRRRRG